MKVLYITGVGRSGSTLLERMLGAVPGSVNAGELNAIFSRVATQDQRCGCGAPFSACPFWTAVGEEAFGGWSSVTARMSSLQPRVVRQRHVPRMVTGVTGSATYRRELEEYVEVHHRLYRAIAAVSGAEVVVDASKSTAQLFALRRVDDLDLRVVNLVRDARGVANSWSKTGIRKPQSDADTMGTYSPHRLAVLWAALQLECAVLGRLVPHAARVRYEDLVAHPRSTLERALRDVGLPPSEGALAHVGERSVVLAPSHGVAGSRTRFTAGRIELRLDDAWQTGLPAGARRLVTAVTLPQLLGYGYLGRRPPTARAA